MSGSVFVFVAILLLQLMYIFAAVAYKSLTADFPFLDDIAIVFRYLVGIPVVMLTVFAGGYLTANIADMNDNTKIGLNCLAVGLVTVSSMMYSALENASMSITGVVVSVLALISTVAGGFYWKKNSKKRALKLQSECQST